MTDETEAVPKQTARETAGRSIRLRERPYHPVTWPDKTPCRIPKIVQLNTSHICIHIGLALSLHILNIYAIKLIGGCSDRVSVSTTPSPRTGKG